MSITNYKRKYQFAVKWRFKYQKIPEAHIIRPQIDIGSNILLLLGDVHALGCRPAFAENHPLDGFPGASASADYNRRGPKRLKNMPIGIFLAKAPGAGPSMHPRDFVDTLTPPTGRKPVGGVFIKA